MQVQRGVPGADVRGAGRHHGGHLHPHERRPVGKPLHRRVHRAPAECPEEQTKGQ